MRKLLFVLEEGGPWACIGFVLSDLSPSYLGFHKSPGVNEFGPRLWPSLASLGVPMAELWGELCLWASPGHLVLMMPAPHIPSTSPAGHGSSLLISGCTEARGPLARCLAGCQGQEQDPQPCSC